MKAEENDPTYIPPGKPVEDMPVPGEKRSKMDRFLPWVVGVVIVAGLFYELFLRGK